MKQIFAAVFMMPFLAYAQPSHDLHCSDGDYETNITFTERMAEMSTCNSDWGCGSFSKSQFDYAPEVSDASFFRYKDATGKIGLEISKHTDPLGEVFVFVNGARFSHCYTTK